MHYLQAVLISNCTSKPTFTVNALISYHGKRTYILSVLNIAVFGEIFADLIS